MILQQLFHLGPGFLCLECWRKRQKNYLELKMNYKPESWVKMKLFKRLRMQ